MALSLLIMTPHIISWATNERSISPISTSPSSVVSIDSISSESSLSHTTQPRVKSMNILGDREFGVHHANDDPFARHDKYFFKDGNITFLVRPFLNRMRLCSPFYSRSTAHSTASTDISFHVIQHTSLLGSTSLEFASTKPCPLLYR